MCQSGSYIKEHNYMGLSDCSSVDSSTISTESEENNCSLNLKATELRLGLPGSLSPGRDPNQCRMTSAKLGEKSLFPLHPSKDGDYFLSHKHVASDNKRGFSDAMDGFAEGNFLSNSEANVMLSPQPSLNSFLKSGLKGDPRSHLDKINDSVHQNKAEERHVTANDTDANCSNAAKNISNVPATKAQVVGWPPIRSCRKNTLASNFKNNDEMDGKAGPGALFVKVSMDGAPYLRNVDLRTYSAYQELSSALEKMFIVGQYGSHGAPGKEMLSEIKLKDLMNGSEYVLTYEDKDGDWMLVGDVPWEMFIETCKKLRIMKSSDAIGLGYANKPRCVDDHAIEKTHL